MLYGGGPSNKDAHKKKGLRTNIHVRHANHFGNTCTCARDALLGSLGVMPRHAARQLPLEGNVRELESSLSL